MPSLGTIQESESHTNLLALSIFVITVTVIICIQLATGVIYSFIVEHAIILFFMLTLMVLLWISAFIVNDHEGSRSERKKNLIKKGPDESLLQRLQVCFLYGYHSNPQVRLCTIVMCGSVSLICIACVVIIAEVLFRSFVFEDNRDSAHEWSIGIVVGTQLLTILVVCFSMGCRWLTFVKSKSFFPVKDRDIPYYLIAGPYYMRNTPRWFELIYSFLYKNLFLPCGTMIVTLIISVSRALSWLFQNSIWKQKQKDGAPVKYFKHLLRKHKVRISGWMLKSGVEDMEKWMELNRRKSTERLRDLLFINHPLDSLAEEIKIWLDTGAARDVSCLSIVLIAEMAKASMPNSLVASLMGEILDEVFHVTYFVDNKINAGSFNSKVKSMTAEVLLKRKTKIYIIRRTTSTVQPQSDIELALKIIDEFHNSFHAVAVRDEVCAIVKFIRHRSYLSLNDLSDQLKILFIYMLRSLLSEIPNAIFNHIVESPAEEYEERVRDGLKFTCELESVESLVGWSFPNGSNITSMTNAHVPTVATKSNVLLGGIHDSSIASATGNGAPSDAFREDDNV